MGGNRARKSCRKMGLTLVYSSQSFISISVAGSIKEVGLVKKRGCLKGPPKGLRRLFPGNQQKKISLVNLKIYSIKEVDFLSPLN